MAYTASDLDTLDAAIASGELTVRVLDSLVTYRSLRELMQARQAVAAAIAEASRGSARLSPRYRLARFSD